MRIRRVIAGLCCGASTFLGPLAAAGSSPPVRPLEIEDAVWAMDLQVQGVAATFSPDGQAVASTVCDPKRRVTGDEEHADATGGVAELRVGCDIWLTPVGGGPSRSLTAAEGNSWAPSWSPDGGRLAFLSDRDGKPRVWIWDRATDRVQRLSEAVVRTWLGLTVPVWKADGTGLVVQLHPEGITEEALEMKHGASTRAADAEPGSTVVVYRSPPVPPGESAGAASSGFAYLLSDLGVMDATSGEVRRLVAGARPAAWRMSPDGRWLAFLDARESAGANVVGPAHTLVVVDLATGRSHELASGIVQEFPGALSWSPDGELIAYTSVSPQPPDSERFASPVGASGAGDLYVVSRAGGEPRRITSATPAALDTDFLPPLWDATGERVFVRGGDRVWRATLSSGVLEPLGGLEPFAVRCLLADAAGNQVWSPDGGRSLVAVTRDDQTKRDSFRRIDLASGAMQPLLEEDREYGHLFDGPVVAPGGDRVVYVAGSSRESPELWVADAAFTSPRRLTSLNPQLDNYAFGEGRLIEFSSADGEALRAALLLPAGYQPGTRYPMVVWVYASDSGSRAVHRFGLVGYPAYNMQMLATRGYAVLWPDIPTRLGTPMQDLMKAVMPAVDRAVELGIADPERLAVMGQSGGGYSTLALLVQTSRFKAAVMNAGYGDLAAMYGQMGYDGSGGWIPWLERLGGSMGAPPWEEPLRYVQNSPVFYLDRSDTPLIVQAGSEDELIVPLSDEVWVGLQRLGKEATYLRYQGEGHVLMKAPNLVDYWKRVIAFFDERVKNVSGEGHQDGGDQEGGQ